jgi:putative membrane protein
MPYCGAPAVPDSLWLRWNLDPILIAALLAFAAVHLARSGGRQRTFAAAGWAVTAFALISPLCALSVSLFAARVGQHVVMILIGAPLIALALPSARNSRFLWPSVAAFTVFLWLWHMPAPYDATLHSDAVYWAMHITLFSSALALWRELLPLGRRPMALVAAGTVASMQMALLGAVLTFAARPLFAWHYATTAAWGLTPLADQQLGGVLMWVPGGLLFLWLALRTAAHLAHEERAATI